MEHRVVTREEWERARQKLLSREKEHTRQSDELARQRRELPWVKIEKPYPFRMPRGRQEGDDFQTWIHRHDEYARPR